MRTLSASAIASLVQETTDEVWLVLLTINHADLVDPIRVVNNIDNITSRGDLFVGFPFSIILPEQGPATIGQAQLQIDNIDKMIVETIRTISSPPTVTIEVVLASQPDTVEMALFDLVLRDSSYDAITVSATMRFEDVAVEPVAESITAQRFPGLY